MSTPPTAALGAMRRHFVDQLGARVAAIREQFGHGAVAARVREQRLVTLLNAGMAGPTLADPLRTLDALGDFRSGGTIRRVHAPAQAETDAGNGPVRPVGTVQESRAGRRRWRGPGHRPGHHAATGGAGGRQRRRRELRRRPQHLPDRIPGGKG